MSLRHTWNVINPEEENTRKYIWKWDTLEEIASKMGH